MAGHVWEESSSAHFKNKNMFTLISQDDSLKLADHTHAVHGCLFAREITPLFESYSSSCLISMQMRFDGKLGFPGGIVDEGQTILDALNRELEEEINLNPKCFISSEDYIFTHVHNEFKSCYHFYAKEISKEDFITMESDALKARDFGKEVMGLIRVPMFTMNDGYRGLPAFFSNNFAGNASNQLVGFLTQAKIMSEEEIQKVLEDSMKEG